MISEQARKLTRSAWDWKGDQRGRREGLQVRQVFLPVRGGAQLADVSPVKGR